MNLADHNEVAKATLKEKDLRKQELIFKILEAQSVKDGLTFSKGVTSFSFPLTKV